MPWPTRGSACGPEGEREGEGEGGTTERLELARSGRSPDPGADRGRGAATARAEDRAGPALLPTPDGGARGVRARVLRHHRRRRTRRGAVPAVLSDRYQPPQPPALRAVPARDR